MKVIVYPSVKIVCLLSYGWTYSSVTSLLSQELSVKPWWRKCIIHSGVLLLLWSIIAFYCYFQDKYYTIQGVMHFCSYWFITIWALSIMREGNSNAIVFYRRLLFLPFVLLIIGFSYWYSGETYLDILIIVGMAFFWFLPFLFNLQGKKCWIRIALLLNAGLITFIGLSTMPTISGAERLRSGNKRLLRYSDIIIEDKDLYKVNTLLSGTFHEIKDKLTVILSSEIEKFYNLKIAEAKLAEKLKLI